LLLCIIGQLSDCANPTSIDCVYQLDWGPRKFA
jgi:hypothetical protein